MSNAILPLVLLGSMGSSAAGIAYGIKTEWEFLGGKKEEEEVYVAPVATQSQSLTGGSLVVDDFVIQGSGDDENYTLIEDEDAISANTAIHTFSTDNSNIYGLTTMPINCGVYGEDELQTAMTGFTMNTTNDYVYTCASLDNPGQLKFANTGTYVSTRKGNINELHQSQALCASNQALVGFVLDQNSSGSKSGYRYDCIDLNGPAKVRTALSPYMPYKEGTQLSALKDIGAIKCSEGELLQGFAAEKSGNNMRYIYRCVTPGYEED